MNFDLKSLSKHPLPRIATDLLVVTVPEAGWPKSHPLNPVAKQAIADKAFGGKAGDTFLVWRPHGFATAQVLLLGVGKGTAAHWRTAMQKLCGWIKDKRAEKVELCLDPKSRTEWLVALRTLDDGLYTYRSEEHTSELQSH